ncbi:EcsC family protein [Actinomyces sp. ICM47]|uniref:EcsC family protein n=1 Tax=Actinomyces sp. ICM47 TaxID=936548 RepID=UPI0025C5AD43|nr:EcsC family protein [Actinomyces sp. ICM47]
MFGKTNDYGVDGELRGITAEQASSAEQHGLDFLKKVVRFPGVRINRDEFLRQELTKLRASEEVIERALATSPALAGVPLLALDTLADETITYETNKSAALSFAAGLPGGFAMLGTIPADLMQYYAHALRIMQKLAYLYGWRDLLADVDEDDEMLDVFAVFFGVMLGVGGAAQSLTAFARIAAKTAYQKHVTKQALMSITWYPVVKYSLRVIGINITKNGFAKAASKIVPVIGGFVSSGLTFMALQTQSSRLKGHLRELPPPGIDAEAWAQHVLDTTPARGKQLVEDEVQETVKGKARVVMVGAKSAVSGIAEGATGIAGGVKQRLRKGK